MPYAAPVTPLPSGVVPPSKYQLFLDWLPDWIHSIFNGMETLFTEKLHFLFLGIIILVAIKLIHLKIIARRNQIEHCWQLLAFFLHKRQTVLPLVWNLSRIEKILPKEKLAEVLVLRKKLEKLPLHSRKKDRFLAEKIISEFLKETITSLEKSPENIRLKKLYQDLEFIDKKLVELQKLYNEESQKWNKWFAKMPRKLGGASFELFK